MVRSVWFTLIGTARTLLIEALKCPRLINKSQLTPAIRAVVVTS